MRLIETHAHIDDPIFKNDFDAVIERAKENVKYILNVGIDLDTSQKSIDLSEKYEDFIYAAVGVHPHNAQYYSKIVESMLKKMAANPKVLALGEIGLDYYRNISDKDSQIRAFRRQLNLAKDLNLPTIIHCREAEEDTFRIVSEENVKNGVFHFYAGDLDMAKKLIDKGFYLSFGGVVTFKKADRLKIIENIPIDRVLLETDCPYVTPSPYRGKRNEPAYIKYVAEKIAEHLKISINDLARITNKNANQLFGFEKKNYYQNIVYRYKNAVYINLTNRCTNDCIFCIRNISENVGDADSLWLDHEPTVNEVMKELYDVFEKEPDIEEVVFCGYGEPMIRVDAIKRISQKIKEKWDNKHIRINTNGLGNIYHGRNILSELDKVIDSVSISLNAENPVVYQKVSQAVFGEDSYNEILKFIELAKKHIKNVQLSVVEINEIDIKKCREVAEKFKLELKIR